MAEQLDSGSELTRLSATVLAGLVRRREVSSVEVVKAHLARIDAVDGRINAFCTVLHDQAMTAARAVDDALAKSSSPASQASEVQTGLLCGVPVALKDLTPTQGIRTTRGSRLYRQHVPDQDAEIVKRIRRAGGIIIGKTNTPEFGHKGITDNLISGPTRNPWHLDRVSGGSSGGSSAAVAAGMVPLAEGSDGAGSIRIPAALCGTFGFKPSFGRVPDIAGPFSSHSPFFHNGPIARNVDDGVLLYSAMAGKHADDPFSLPTQGPVTRDPEAGVRALRIAYSPDLGYFAVDPELALQCRRGAQRFTDLGCQVDEVQVRLDLDVEHHFMTLWRMKMVGLYGSLPQADLDQLEPKVRQLIEEGRQLTAQEYGQANMGRERVWNELLRLFRSHDLLVCPTTAVSAFPVPGQAPAAVNGKAINPLLGWFLTYPFNLTGNPAASVPCGMSSDGLPIGLQIIGPRLADALVLQAAWALEHAAPWPQQARVETR